MQGDGMNREPPTGLPDVALWRRGRMIDAAEDEAARYLDLAGFADGLLDPDDSERVAEWLAGDPIAADDVAVARRLSDAVEQCEAAPVSVVARASALVDRREPHGEPHDDSPAGNIIRLPPRHRVGPRLHLMARWGSLVAAMAVASWLGFTLGMDTSRSFAQGGRAGEEGFLNELLDPSTGFMRDLTEGTQT